MVSCSRCLSVVRGVPSSQKAAAFRVNTSRIAAKSAGLWSFRALPSSYLSSFRTPLRYSSDLLGSI